MIPRRTVCSLVIAVILMASALVVVGCSKGQPVGYGSFQLFVYPRESDPMEGTWQYRMCVTTVSDRGGSDFALTQKGARVTIAGTDGKLLLDESYQFGRRAGIESTATWSVPETVTLEIREHGFVYSGHPAPDDAYNAELVKSGDRVLKTVTYHLDSTSKRFVAVP